VSFDGLRYTQLCEALVTGSGALIHCEQALVIGEKRLYGVSQQLRIHIVLLVSCSSPDIGAYPLKRISVRKVIEPEQPATA
jgi:hypothetical protein